MLALRKKKERAHTTALWATLEFLAPIVEDNESKKGYRSKSLGTGRSKEVVLKDVVEAVRNLTSLTGSRTQQTLEAGECGVGLLGVLLETGQIIHASRAFLDIGCRSTPLSPKAQSMNPNP